MSTNTKKHEKRIRPSIKRDRIQASDLLKYNPLFSCDNCSHFSHENELCTLGYNAEHHRLAEQMKTFNMSGTMAYCRFHEID
jgi:ribosomal protein L32